MCSSVSFRPARCLHEEAMDQGARKVPQAGEREVEPGGRLIDFPFGFVHPSC